MEVEDKREIPNKNPADDYHAKADREALYLELKPNLQCVYVVLKTGRFSHLDVETDSIKLEEGDNSLVWDLSFLAHSLRVNTCNGLNKKTKSEIHFRLQTTQKDECEQNNVPSPSSRLPCSNRPLSEDSVCAEPVILACGTCQQFILDTGSYKRCLPLPSDGWTEMSESWFCHQTSPDTCETRKVCLLPKPGDLLYSDFYMLTNFDNLHGVCHKSTQNSLLCSRCKHQLGEMTESKGTVQLYLHCLSFCKMQPSTDLFFPLICLESTFTQHLMEQSDRNMTYKFILESKVNNKLSHQALLWVLEKDLQLAFGAKDGCVESFDAIKLLYLPTFKASNELMSSWLADNRVSSLVLPPSACVQMIDTLQHSTLKLPTSLMKAGDMFVGFLKLGETVSSGAE